MQQVGPSPDYEAMITITYGDLDAIIDAIAGLAKGTADPKATLDGLSPLQHALSMMIISNDRAKRINAFGIIMTLAKKAPPSEGDILALITAATEKKQAP